jgi:3'(2'), 5'-bisphosphate nucleotidase
MKKLLPEIVAIAIQAGYAISEIYAEPAIAVMIKGNNSPLTQADLASDRVIKAGLVKLNLAWPVLTEESAQVAYEDRKDWQRFWLIDPLDGTKDFVKRNGEFTVNIALIENGQPILGVVYAPILNVCYYAATGVGAFVKRAAGKAQSILVPPTAAGRPIKVVASRSHTNQRTSALLNKLGDYGPNEGMGYCGSTCGGYDGRWCCA